MTAPRLAASGLHKRFGAVMALDDVSLAADAGELVAIIGPSGCGKSTLLRCLNFLDLADRGSVALDGVRVDGADSRARHAARARIGMVFQGFHLFAHRSVVDNVMLAPRVVRRIPRDQARAEAEALLAKVGLSAQAHRRPATLSGGQQQRAAIARALAMRPDVMLYDEPTSALDPELRQEVLQVMRDLDAEGMTQIVVTHEMGFAQAAADTVVHMQDGAIVERAPAARLFAAPTDPRTRRFLSRLAAAVLLCCAATPVMAETLRWGADAQSGAPYVFHDPRAPDHLTGYEADLITSLATRLHRTPVFVQNDWDGLIPGLQRGLYDVVIDGLEITPAHRAVVDFTTPYYLTYEQLAVRRADTAQATLAALRGQPIGTLKASVGERILRDQGFTPLLYDEEVNAYADLANGRLQAVLLDQPIAQYYAAPDPRLALVGAPIGQLAYGIALAPGHHALRAELDAALRAMRSDGTLRAILQRWNLWTPLMAANDPAPPAPALAPTAYTAFLAATAPQHRFADLLARYAGFLPLIGRAAVLTLAISMAAMAVAVTAGLALALARLHASRPLAWLATLVIEIVRGTPLLIQILFIFYGLPSIGLRLPPFVAGVLALGLNYAAYEAENDRAALQAVPHGQMEAAIALNLTTGQALRHVVLPQALRIVLPVMTNDFISLLKDSSLVSIITLTELTQTYVRLSTTYYDYLGTGLLVGAAYLLIGVPFVRLSRWAERRLAAGAA